MPPVLSARPAVVKQLFHALPVLLVATLTSQLNPFSFYVNPYHWGMQAQKNPADHEG